MIGLLVVGSTITAFQSDVEFLPLQGSRTSNPTTNKEGLYSSSMYSESIQISRPSYLLELLFWYLTQYLLLSFAVFFNSSVRCVSCCCSGSCSCSVVGGSSRCSIEECSMDGSRWMEVAVAALVIVAVRWLEVAVAARLMDARWMEVAVAALVVVATRWLEVAVAAGLMDV